MKRPRAFSLIELLVVIAIVAILAVICIPAISSMGRSSSLTGSTQSLTGALELARQTAVTQNRPVEVRFYKLPDYNQPATAAPAVYRAMQTFVVDYDNTNAATKVSKLSNPVIISSDPNVSSLMNDTNFPEQAAPAGVTLPEFGSNYRYRSFLFKPDGGTDLSRDRQLFFTMHVQNDKIVTNNLPANFVTIQIEPMTGRTKVIRP